MAEFTPYPTVIRDVNPNVRQDIQTSPDMFGGQVARAKINFGQAVQQGAEGLNRLGQTLTNIGVAQNQLNDEIYATQVNTKATQDITQMYVDYSSLEGEDAVNGYAPYQKKISDYIGGLLDGMPNNYTKRLLSSSLASIGNRYTGYAASHAASENKKWEYNTAKAAADNYGGQAAIAIDNPFEMGAQLALGAQSMTKIAEQKGLDPVGTQNLIKGYYGEQIQLIAKGLIEGGDPRKAEKVLNDYRDRMDPQSIVQVQTWLKQPIQALDADDLAKNAVTPGGKGQIIGNTQGASPQALTSLQRLSQIFGPIKVNAAASRTQANPGGTHSFEGGHSDHDHGDAFDVDISKYSNLQKLQLLSAAKQAGFTDFGLGNNIIHLGRHGNPRAWTYGGEGKAGIGGSNSITSRTMWAGAPAAQLKRDIMENPGKALPGLPQAPGLPSKFSVMPPPAIQYRNAIAAVESRGTGDYTAVGKPTRTGDKAYGRYQVMGANIPDWTKEVLGRSMSPQEFLNDPKAQDAIFDAKFGGMVRQYGSVEKAARAWFTGSPTGKGSDSLGTSADEYVAKFMRALGQPSDAAPVSGRMVPKGEAIQNIIDQTQGNPGLQAAAIAAANKMYTNFANETAEQRLELQTNVPAMIKAAAQGQENIDFPYDDIINYMDPVKAGQWLQEFQIAQNIGSVTKNMKFGSQAQIDAIQGDLANGRGPISDAIDKMGLDPTEGFKLKQYGLEQLKSVVDDRQKRLTSDPAGFALENETVNEAYKAYQAMPTDSKAFEKYARAQTVVQANMGVVQPRVFTKDFSENMAAQISHTGNNALEMLSSLKKVSGDAWPMVWKDLVEQGKLPPAYQALAILANKGDAENTQLLQRALQESKGDPKTWNETLNRTADVTKSMLDGVITAVDPYVQSLRASDATPEAIKGFIGSVQMLALARAYYANDPNAVNAAANAFIGNYSYLPWGGARVPTAAYDRVSANFAAFQQNVTMDQLTPPAGDEFTKASWLAAVKSKATLITDNETNNKAFLEVPVKGGFAPVLGKNGLPIAVMFGGGEAFENIDMPSAERAAFERLQSVGESEKSIRTLSQTQELSPTETEASIKAAEPLTQPPVPGSIGAFGQGIEPASSAKDYGDPVVNTYAKGLVDSKQFTEQEVEDKVEAYKKALKK